MGIISEKQKNNQKIYSLIFAVTYVPALVTYYIPDLLSLFLGIDLLIIIHYIYKLKLRFSLFTIFVFIFQLSLIISDLVNGSSVYTHLRYMCMNLIPCLVFDSESRKNNLHNVLNGFLFTLRIYILIHLATRVIFPEGVYRNHLIHSIGQYFLENDNSTMPYIYIYMILTLVNVRLFEEEKRWLFYDFAICVGLTFYSWSATGVVVVTIIFASAFVSKFKAVQNKAVYIALLLIVLYFFIDIVVNSNTSIGLINISLKILGKSSDFSGRTYLWNQALQIIHEKPILGAGLSETTLTISSLGGIRGMGAHNHFLEIAVEGGLVGVGLFFTVIVVGSIKNRSAELKNQLDTMAFIYFSLSGIMIGMQMETYSSAWCLIMVLCMSYYLKLMKQENTVSKQCNRENVQINNRKSV